jgi:hypothetical protein
MRTATVRVIDVFVDEFDLKTLGFERADPAASGRPGYSPPGTESFSRRGLRGELVATEANRTPSQSLPFDHRGYAAQAAWRSDRPLELLGASEP